nr:PEP/pyruvate-binding domain-containing protein [uncultured Flavobacterium sp.]
MGKFESKKQMQQFTKLLSDITAKDLADAGKKATQLGILYKEQKKSPLQIPPGFVVNVAAYLYFISYNNLHEKLQALINTIPIPDYDNIIDVSAKCRRLILSAKIPRNLETELSARYASLFPNEEDVAVRNSIAGEDVPYGLADTYLNIRGSIALSYAVKCCFASLFSERALLYRLENSIELPLSMAVIVQKMVRSDLGASGTVCVKDDKIIIKSVLGLGEILSTTESEPDTYEFSSEKNMLLQKNRGKKGRMSVYSDHAAGTNSTLLRITPAEVRDVFSITDNEARSIISFLKPEENNCFEWAKDGITNVFYLISVNSL